jgi:hypothetical protein
MMYEPLAAPLSSRVIVVPEVRLVGTSNAYSEKLVGAAKPFATSPADQLTNDSDPPSVKPSASYAVPVDDAVSVPVCEVKP